MTDNEIIKAMECCSCNSVDDCDDCPRFDVDDKTTVDCMCCLMREALDLINRQKAEIERLQKDINVVNNVIKNTFLLKADKNNDPFAEIKAEAIKEFAERLKEKKFELNDQNEDIFYAVEVSDIDNLVKEMVGDING
jgi:hypothetical protein